ncbi:9520_t:CDS:2 [Rhizophagus irregularis]|nr:9520_t:CDS:2 [Rhizophagus irregularis]
MDSEFLLNLLEASDRFKLFDKVDYLQSYLIEVRSSWIYDNIFKLIPTAFENDNFHQLKSFVIDLICKDTKWFLSLKQFNDLPENQLIKFLQINDLSIEEFHVWNAVLSWSFKRNADLNEKKVIQWSDKEIDRFKTTLKPFIPFIRFFQISSVKYWDYIHEFDKVLPEGLVNEILEYYFKSSLPVNYSLLPLRNVRMIDSDIISSEQAEIISLWIGNKNPEKLMVDSPRYLPDDDELMDMEENNNTSNNDSYAFLFFFNKNGKNKMGKINSSDISYFIHNCNDCGPCFGTTDLWITPKEAHSDEHNIAYQPLSNFGYHRKDCYDIELREEPGGFQIVDYEVFQVVHV